MAKKICPVCNEMNAEDAKLCISCGKNLMEVKSIGISEEQKENMTQNYNSLYSCSICGKVNNGSKICPECGGRCYVSKSQYETPTYESKKDTVSCGIYILSFFIPLVGIIIGSIWLASDDSNKKENGKSVLITAIISILIFTILNILFI